MNFADFLEIRKMWAQVLPDFMDEYEATGNMHNDPYLHDWQFTPIEAAVWSDIRCAGLPFFPQIPVLNYFLDFGCPFLKIGIECDGKEWHDAERDAIRDERLAAEGWMIFRIQGHECKRVIAPWPEYYEDEGRDELEIENYFMNTSEGVIHALRMQYFAEYTDERNAVNARMTLNKHRSTPETFPKRLRVSKRLAPPQFISDYLASKQ